MGMKKRKLLVALLILLIMLAMAGGYLFMAGKPQKATLLKIIPSGVDLQVKEVKYEELGATGVKWEVNADTATYQKKENMAYFDRVRIKFTMKDGSIYQLSSDRGKINTVTNDMELYGNIIIHSDKGDRFKTERLKFSRKDELIFTNEPVTMQNDYLLLQAKGMTLSLKDERLTLASSVRAQVKPLR